MVRSDLGYVDFHENKSTFQKWTKINVQFQKPDLKIGKCMYKSTIPSLNTFYNILFF